MLDDIVCPVVAKAHRGHPGTCEKIGGAIVAAAEQVVPTTMRTTRICEAFHGGLDRLPGIRGVSIIG